MRRIIIVTAALGLMWGLPHLAVSAQHTAFDPLTLAAIGFVLLAAFAVGEFGAVMKLPKVTGYIVSGLLLGPFVLNILSTRVAGEMQVFNTLALGLIATTAGLELDVRSMAKVSRTMLATIVFKLLFLLILVGGAFYLLQTYWPVLPNIKPKAVIALALLFSVLAIGTSPAITIAVLSESKSKGRLSDMALAIAVAKDLVVVVFLALAISYIRAWLNPELSLDTGVLIKVGRELGLSLALGALIGVIMILYSKFLRAEQLMALVAVVIVAAEVCRMFHLELLLVLIMTGFVVRNFSHQEHFLLEPLVRISLPVFVVFFTTAGANVDLVATTAILPLAITIVAARAIAFFIASYLGGMVGKENRAIRANAWMAYLPQAGVTLGLILVAAEALPELATSIHRTGMAIVGINLLLGPVLMSLALRRVGEVPGPQKLLESETISGESATDFPKPVVDSTAIVSAPSSPESASIALTCRPLSLSETKHKVGSSDLATQMVALERALWDTLGPFIDQVCVPLSGNGRRTITRLIDKSDIKDIYANIVELLAVLPPETPMTWERDITTLFDRQLSIIRVSPAIVTAPITATIVQRQTGDSISLRFRKAGVRAALALGLSGARVREVPFRLIGSICFEPLLAKTIATVSASWHRAIIAALTQVRQALDDFHSTEENRASIERIFLHWRQATEADLKLTIHRGALQMCERLAIADSPRLPRRKLHYSKVAPTVQRERASIDVNQKPWRTVVQAAYQTVRIAALVRLTERQLSQIVQHRLTDPLEQMEIKLIPAAQIVVNRIQSLADEIAEEKNWEPAVLERIFDRANNLFPTNERRAMRSYAATFRGVTRKSHISEYVADVLSRVPGTVEVFPSGIRADSITAPNEVSLVEINFGLRMVLLLREQFLKSVTQLSIQIGTQVVDVEPTIRETVHLITYGVEVALNRKDDSASVKAELVQGASVRAAQRAAQQYQEMAAAIDAARAGIRVLQAELPDQLQEVSRRKPTSMELIQGSAVTSAKISLKKYTQLIRQWVSSRWIPFAQFVTGASKRSMEEWQIQSGAVRLDAAGIAQYCNRRIFALDHVDLPRIYKEVLTLEPLSDRRMLSARIPLIESIVAAIYDKGDDAHLLLVGSRGSGKTTILTELHFRLTDRRVLRFDAGTLERGDDLIAELADELDCANDFELVEERLKTRRPIVLFDDLEKVLSPAPEGISMLESWLKLIVSTHGSAKWVVTVNSETLKVLLDLALPFKKVFGRIITLESLDWQTLREVITVRQRFAGIAIRTGRQLGPLDFLFNWRSGSRESQYYRTLEHASRGNLRAALLIHLYSLKRDGDSLIATQPQDLSLSFLSWLPSDAIALVAQLIRFGPMSEQTLRDFFVMNADEMAALLLFLERAGLVERRTLGYRNVFRVPVHLQDVTATALTKRNIFQDGTL